MRTFRFTCGAALIVVSALLLLGAAAIALGLAVGELPQSLHALGRMAAYVLLAAASGYGGFRVLRSGAGAPQAWPAMSEASYREQALKLFPWICGRCRREFSGKNLRELTVHHKDHDHHNNPPDGSNWELLCLYCHDNEHARQLEAAQQRADPGTPNAPHASHKPFADLKDRLKNKP